MQDGSAPPLELGLCKVLLLPLTPRPGQPQQLHYLVVYHNMNHTNGGLAIKETFNRFAEQNFDRQPGCDGFLQNQLRHRLISRPLCAVPCGYAARSQPVYRSDTPALCGSEEKAGTGWRPTAPSIQPSFAYAPSTPEQGLSGGMRRFALRERHGLRRQLR